MSEIPGGKNLETVREILSIPTAPFCEKWLSGHIAGKFKNKKAVKVRRDCFGNLLLQYRPGSRGRSGVCFQAHLDHPGFILADGASGREAVARIHGGIPAKPVGGGVRFFTSPGDKGVAARITEVIGDPADRSNLQARFRFSRKVELPAGTFGMWDYPALKVGARWIQGRAFDDTLGVGILVKLLLDAVAGRWKKPFDVLFTCAEEPGLLGAGALLENKTLPLPPVVVTVEMPRAIGEIVAGEGFILRVGDFYSAYDNNLLLAVGEIARKISAGDKEFAFQRKLAYAGTTESSLFLLHGYAATALCLPTVNCHNRDDSEHPAIEKINRNDLRSLELVLNAIAREGIDPKGAGKRLLQAFKKRQAAGMKLLRAAYGNA